MRAFAKEFLRVSSAQYHDRYRKRNSTSDVVENKSKNCGVFVSYEYKPLARLVGL